MTRFERQQLPRICTRGVTRGTCAVRAYTRRRDGSAFFTASARRVYAVTHITHECLAVPFQPRWGYCVYNRCVSFAAREIASPRQRAPIMAAAITNFRSRELPVYAGRKKTVPSEDSELPPLLRTRYVCFCSLLCVPSVQACYINVSKSTLNRDPQDLRHLALSCL